MVDDQSADVVVNTMLMSYSPRYGDPRSIISDNGTAYRSELNKAAMDTLDINQLFISPYHAQTNALSELTVKGIKAYYRTVNVILDNLIVQPECVQQTLDMIRALLQG